MKEVFTFNGFVQRLWVKTYLEFYFGFSTITSPLSQSVGFWTGSMISKSTICFNSVSILGFKATGIFLTGVATGVTLSLIPQWSVNVRVPTCPKQSGNLSLAFMTEIHFNRFRLSLVDNPRIGTDIELTTINKISK